MQLKATYIYPRRLVWEIHHDNMNGLSCKWKKVRKEEGYGNKMEPHLTQHLHYHTKIDTKETTTRLKKETCGWLNFNCEIKGFMSRKSKWGKSDCLWLWGIYLNSSRIHLNPLMHKSEGKWKKVELKEKKEWFWRNCQSIKRSIKSCWKLQNQGKFVIYKLSPLSSISCIRNQPNTNYWLLMQAFPPTTNPIIYSAFSPNWTSLNSNQHNHDTVNSSLIKQDLKALFGTALIKSQIQILYLGGIIERDEFRRVKCLRTHFHLYLICRF